MRRAFVIMGVIAYAASLWAMYQLGQMAGVKIGQQQGTYKEAR